MEEKAYAYWLHNVPGIGDKSALTLLRAMGSIRAVYHATEESLSAFLSKKQAAAILQSKGKWKLGENYEKLVEKKIQMVCPGEKEYPERLRKMASPPFVLYYLGKLPEEEKLSLAIIGARECSDYGSSMAKAFAMQAAAAGIPIISGMARGIDGIGQQAALEAGGETFAVLGCGVDVCYPASNRSLYEEITKRGGILSPYPPGTAPVKNLFPYRNQIVAGLSDGVLVIEARQKSGTLITVDMALEQGKEVYAVPGRLTDRLSDGCNYLIRQGAGIALTPEDVIRELAIIKNRQGTERKAEVKEEEKKKAAEENRKKEETGILRFLDLHPLSADEIQGKMKQSGEEIPFSQLLFELIQLCMEGKARQIGGNYFVKVLK